MRHGMGAGLSTVPWLVRGRYSTVAGLWSGGLHQDRSVARRAVPGHILLEPHVLVIGPVRSWRAGELTHGLMMKVKTTNSIYQILSSWQKGMFTC